MQEDLLRHANAPPDEQQLIPTNQMTTATVGHRCRGAANALVMQENLLRHTNAPTDERQLIPTNQKASMQTT